MHVRAAVRGLVNLNVHFHLVVPDGVFVDDKNWLAFALHPVPTSADVVAILDRITRRIARRLPGEARDDRVEEGGDVLAQVQAEAAATWRSPQNRKPTVPVLNVCARGGRASRCTPAL